MVAMATAVVKWGEKRKMRGRGYAIYSRGERAVERWCTRMTLGEGQWAAQQRGGMAAPTTFPTAWALYTIHAWAGLESRVVWVCDSGRRESMRERREQEKRRSVRACRDFSRRRWLPWWRAAQHRAGEGRRRGHSGRRLDA